LKEKVVGWHNKVGMHPSAGFENLGQIAKQAINSDVRTYENADGEWEKNERQNL
jgi:hypothetical protein